MNFSTGSPTLNYTGLAGGEAGIASLKVNDSTLFTVLGTNGIYRGDNSMMDNSFGLYAYNWGAEFEICPVPGSPGQYYVIYTSYPGNSLYYSIVDMSLDGGAGNVINLNTLITNDNIDYGSGLELVSIPGTADYWLITYIEQTGLQIFKLDSSGINPTSTFNFDAGLDDLRGELDYYDGKAFLLSPRLFAGAPAPNIPVAIFDFDPNTGLASSLVTLNIEAAIGGEFSPDGSKLYITSWNTNNNNLHQYDLNTGITTSCSVFDLPIGISNGFGQIEMGTDENLYSPGNDSNYILKIENSNDVSFTYSFIPTNYKLEYGVSNILDFILVLDAVTLDVSCFGASDGQATISMSGGVGPYTVDWSHTNEQIGEPATGLAPGTYTAFVADGIGNLDSISVTITSPPPAGIVDFGAENTEICLGDLVTFLNFSSSYSPFVQWNWSFGDSLNSELQTPVHLYSSPDTYDVSLSITDLNGCVVDTTLFDFITVSPLPEAHFSSESRVSSCNLEVEFLNGSSNYTGFSWDFGDEQTSTETSPIHIYAEPGSYNVQLIAHSVYCTDTTYLDVPTDIVPTFFTPNTFSPNDDGVNDLFYGYGSCFEEFELWVFNRWGTNVFYTNDHATGWGGRLNGFPCPIGSFVWKASYAGGEQERVTKHGVINLIR